MKFGVILIVLATFIAFCSCQCYSANLAAYHSNCGFYYNETISFLNGTVVIESIPSYEISIVSNYSQSCYFGLGGCSSTNVIGGNTGLACNAPYCTLSFSVSPSLYTGFSLGPLYSSSYFTPLIVNITVRTEDGNYHFFNTTKSSSSNCTAPYPSNNYNFTSSITSVQIAGNYFFIEGFTFCSAPPPPNNCAPQLTMFNGGSSCRSFNPNQCVNCTTSFGQTYYYTASCETVGGACLCTSYLHTGYNCTGSQLAQPMANETCSALSSFYPNTGSVCIPIYSTTPSHTIVVYNSTYPGQADCYPVQENSCYRCSEYGQSFYFKPTCSAPNQCHVTQSYYSDCSSPVVTTPIPNADCYELATLYGSQGGFGCAFGFYSQNQFNKTVTAASDTPVQPTTTPVQPTTPITVTAASDTPVQPTTTQ